MLHRVIAACFSTSRNFWPFSLMSGQETEHVVQDWMQGLTATFFDEGIQKLVP
jgi:hypothetical protein